MQSENYNLLIKGLDFLNITYTEQMINRFNHYLLLYKKWNEKMNISSIREEKGIVIRHLLDSLAPIPILVKYDFLKLSDKCLDLGSGGGLPGVPLKIVYPQMDLDFAEVNKKKVCFLKEVILNLPLKNVNVIDSSIGKVNRDYQLILVRAYGSLKKIVGEARKYMLKGKIMAYKGREVRIIEEIDELSIGQKSECILKKWALYKIKTPFLNEERHIVIIDI